MVELVRNTCRGTDEKREEAGSLASLGMTTRKAKARTKQERRTRAKAHSHLVTLL